MTSTPPVTPPGDPIPSPPAPTPLPAPAPGPSVVVVKGEEKGSILPLVLLVLVIGGVAYFMLKPEAPPKK